MDFTILDDIDRNIYGSEEDSMRWFDGFLKSSKGTFATSVELFQKYYNRCVNDLVHLTFDADKERVEYDLLGDSPEKDSHYECNYINKQDIDDCIQNSYHLEIIKILRDNSYLRDSVERLGLIDENTMSKIMALSEEEVKGLTTEKLYLLFYNEYVSSGKISEDKKNEMIISLLKVHRLNNLQIKYAHTARVVYLTNLELSQTNIDSDFVRSMALTSALFHDVGRFYQGAFYNSYNDGDMKLIEGSGKGHAEAGYYYSLLDMISLNTLGVSTSEDLIIHAIAALVVQRHQSSNAKNKDFDMIQENVRFSDDIDVKLLKFVLKAYSNAEPFKGGIHARFGAMVPHQQQYMQDAMNDAINKILGSIKNIAEQYSSDEKNIDAIVQVIKEYLENDSLGGYLKNTPITKEGFYSSEEVTILEGILGEQLNKYKGPDGKIAVCDFLSQEITDYRMHNNRSSIFFLTEKEMEILKSITIPEEIQKRLLIKKSINDGPELVVRTPEINQILDDYRMKEFCSNKNLNIQSLELILKTLKHDLSKFAQFDIVDSIINIFSGEKEIDPEVRSAIDFCLNMVMDMDKLDIFVQRVNKRWANWNPKYIKVKPSEEQSFLDVIENVFGIPLEKDADGKVVFSGELKQILLENLESNTMLKKAVNGVIGDVNIENLSPSAISELLDLLSNDFKKVTTSCKVPLNENNNMIFDKPLIMRIRNKMKSDKNLSMGIEQLGVSIDLSLVGTAIPEKLVSLLNDYDDILWEKKDNNVVKVSYDLMGKVFPDDKERIEREQLLILPDDLREKVFMFDKDRPCVKDSKFQLGDKASSNENFLWGNSFPAIWWHLDQFIMTNMRSMESLRFIAETKMLDRLKKVYCSPECPKDFISFVDEIIDYCKEFIDVALNTRVDSNGDLVFNEGGTNILMTDNNSMIQIRDEACRRWHEKKKSTEIQDMIDDYLDDSGAKSLSGETHEIKLT